MLNLPDYYLFKHTLHIFTLNTFCTIYLQFTSTMFTTCLRYIYNIPTLFLQYSYFTLCFTLPCTYIMRILRLINQLFQSFFVIDYNYVESN